MEGFLQFAKKSVEWVAARRGFPTPITYRVLILQSTEKTSNDDLLLKQVT